MNNSKHFKSSLQFFRPAKKKPTQKTHYPNSINIFSEKNEEDDMRYQEILLAFDN